MSTIILALGDLSCGHCVKSVTEAIERIAGEGSARVSLNFAEINSDKDPQVFIDAITAAGYKAKIAEPDFELELAGLSCEHCINSTKKALASVANVEATDVTKTHAKIYGAADPAAAIKAVVDAGYEAILMGERVSPKL
ncbi:ZntA protein [Pasteurellaceae bacterium LIM206]|nr:ZntA protein [Pasteurellaceae bacterium LIM206]